MFTPYWKEVSFILRGKQRKKVLKVLDGPALVSEIKNKTKLSLAETSRVLRGLTEQGLAECKNPEDHLGRFYQLTPRGEKIKKLVEDKLNILVLLTTISFSKTILDYFYLLSIF
jgi:predicted transcriptional regulator